MFNHDFVNENFGMLITLEILAILIMILIIYLIARKEKKKRKEFQRLITEEMNVKFYNDAFNRNGIIKYIRGSKVGLLVEADRTDIYEEIKA